MVEVEMGQRGEWWRWRLGRGVSGGGGDGAEG